VAGGAAVASYAGTTSVAAAIGAPRAAAVSAPAPSAATITANNANNAAAAAASAAASAAAAEAAVISSRTAAMIDVAKVQGQVHAQSVQKVGELAEKNPPEAVSVIRTWLHEDAA
jgi:flagellar M-ring protein FliF